ncbi:MAG: hypothetical protein Q9167_001860 [Letrouitia subvulpina]
MERTPVQVADGALGQSPSELYEPVEHAFVDYIRAPDHHNKSRLSYQRYREYKSFLQNPERRPINPTESNWKLRAKKGFKIVNRVLYQQAGSEGNSKPDAIDRKVLTESAVFGNIKRQHEQGGYKGVSKTWALVEYYYHGVNREEVAWFIRNYESVRYE